MKKTIIYFLLIAVLAINFAQAQVFPEMVPVIDPKAVQALSRIGDVLDSILTLFGNEFKKLNLTTSRILETQFQQMAGKIAVDSLKAQQYLKNLNELEKFLEIREEKVKASSTAYAEALEEAKIVGAYLGLQDFINGLNCLNPRIRDELTNYLKDLNREFNLSLKAEDLLNKIPDCPYEEKVTVALRPNFFAWLTQPFKLNLAQTTQLSPEEEIPSITITPAFQETEDSIELSDLENLSASLIKSRAKEKEEERKKEIGKAWPVEECAEFIEVDRYINRGKPLCKRYNILIPGEDVEKFKQELALNNPLTNTAQDINVFQVLTKPQSVANQTGISTSSVSTSSDFAGTFSSKEETKKVVDRICASYKYGEGEDNLTSAYALCLKQFNEQLKKLAEIQKNEVENKKKNAEEAQKKMEEAEAKADQLKDQIDPNVCPGAYEDLEEITQELGGKVVLYTGLIGELSRVSSQLNSLMSQINNLSFQIDDLLNQVLTTSADVLKVINNILSLFKSILSWFGLDLNLPIINDILGRLQNLRAEILPQVRQIIQKFNQVLDPLSELISRFNQLSYNLYQSDFTHSSVLNDLYELDLILQKLDAYERAVLKGECSSGSSSSGVSLIKNQVIVVESKKEQKKSFNLFASLKNLFAPKIVEIRNEK
jgi:hypothetical protein